MSLNTPQNIIDSFPTQLFAVKSKDIYRLLKDLRSNPAVETCYAFGEFLHLTLKDDHHGIKTLDNSLCNITQRILNLNLSNHR